MVETQANKIKNAYLDNAKQMGLVIHDQDLILNQLNDIETELDQIIEINQTTEEPTTHLTTK